MHSHSLIIASHDYSEMTTSETETHEGSDSDSGGDKRDLNDILETIPLGVCFVDVCHQVLL